MCSSLTIGSDNVSSSSGFTHILHMLDSAAEELMVKDFHAAMETCERGLESLAGMDREDARSAEFKAGFCILMIQALAELNLWEGVLSWVLQQYKSQEEVPTKIMQMCILLYSKVGKPAMIQQAARVWLHSPSNCRTTGFRTVAELYLLHVLVPLGQAEEARGLIDGEVGRLAFTEDQRQTALEIVAEKEREDSEPPRSPCQDRDRTTEPCQITASPLAILTTRAKAALRFLYRRIVTSSSGCFSLRRLFLAALLLYILLVRFDPALPSSFVWISKLLQLLRQMWNSMFAPYHLAISSGKGL